MKYIYIVLLTSVIHIQSFSQRKDLIGRWVLDKVVYANGNDLEINHPLYSAQLFYNISSNSIEVNDITFKAKFSQNQIKTDFKTSNYSIENSYLKIQDVGDEKIMYLLKYHDFIKNYPDFELKKIVRERDTLLIANELADYEFEREGSFIDFIRKNMSEYPSRFFQNLYFQVEFVLTKDNKVRNIKVLNSILESYDREYVEAIKKSEKYLKNNSGENLLIRRESNHFKFYKDLTTKTEQDLYKLIEQGDKYYDKNEFENAIVEYEKIKLLKIKENHYKIHKKDAFIKLGVSYLIIGDAANACTSFELAGESTDFKIRNYINHFCR